MAATWIGCLLSIFLECRPFAGYSQVYPYPGSHCTTARDQVITMSSTNIVTNILLMSIPLPTVVREHLSVKTKAQLCVLFVTGFFIVAISITRIAIIFADFSKANLEINELIWGQIECFTATLVVNAPIIHSLLSDRHAITNMPKFRSKYTSNSTANSTRRDVKLSRFRNLNGSNHSWQVLQDDAAATLNRFAIFRTIELRHESHNLESEVDDEAPDIGEVRTAVNDVAGDRINMWWKGMN